MDIAAAYTRCWLQVRLPALLELLDTAASAPAAAHVAAAAPV